MPSDSPILLLIAAALGGGLALALAWGLGQGRRAARLKQDNARLALEAEQGREILAAAPDGLFLWNHAEGEVRCSRRLAVLLGLDAGTGAGFDDILARFSKGDAAALEAAVSLLHREGRSFDLLLGLGRRTIQASGTRASRADGVALDDLMWMRDVTAVPAAAAQPRDADAFAHFRLVLDALPLAVWVRGGDLDVAFANRAAAAIGIPDRLGEDGRDLARRALENGLGQTAQRAGGGDGAARLFDISEAPARGWNGTIGFAVDLAEPDQRAGDAARRGGALNEVLDNLQTAVCIFSANRRLAFANAAFAELWDIDAEWLADEPSMSEILDRLREQRRLPEVTDFRAFKEEQMALFGALEGPEESLLHLPDGRTLRRVAAAHGDGGLVLSFEDVSDRLDLERSFKTLNAVQMETLDNLFEGVAVFGSDGRLQLSNPVFRRIWRLGGAAAPGGLHMADFIEATRPLLAGAAQLGEDAWRAHAEDQRARLARRRPDGGRLALEDGRVLEYSQVPLPDGAVLLGYLDVSDSARVEAALRQRAEALDQANRLKSEFIANVSLEVRTPLTTLRGYAEILTQEHHGALNPRQKEYAQGIVECAESLSGVINDILDLATIEAGMMALELDTVDIHTMLTQVFTLIRERARRKRLHLQFDCPPDIGWMVADEKRLKQVLFNLLSNAVGFTPSGGTVTLSAAVEGSGEAARIAFSVADTGTGIPKRAQGDIFEPFVSGRGEGGEGGAGLGLSLVKRFVELHGGSIEIKSPPGKGTRAICRLPAASAGRGEAALAAPDDPAGGAG